MAIATTRTLLPLDRFFRIAGIHPLHGNQVTVQDIAPAATCSNPLLQFSYQDADRTGREEIAQMIAGVESRLIDYLNFSPKPQYYKNDATIIPKLGAPGTNYSIFTGHSFTPSNVLSQPIGLGAGYFIGAGQEQKVYFLLAAPITYTDTDSDGYFETATVVVSNIDSLGNVVTAWQDVSVYYPEHLADDEWEIRPVDVDIDITLGTITCVFKREQAVIPDLLFGYVANGIDGLDNSAFLQEVDVYHHWLDATQTQTQLSLSSTGETATGIIVPKNNVLGWGLVQPAHYDASVGGYVYDYLSLCGMPDTITVWFKAGWPLDVNGHMADVWERCITYLALSELDRPICQCPSLSNFTVHWSYDFAENNSVATHHISPRKLDNPIGTTRAAMYVWEQILRYRNPDSV